jgi:hypothetical protein
MVVWRSHLVPICRQRAGSWPAIGRGGSWSALDRRASPRVRGCGSCHAIHARLMTATSACGTAGVRASRVTAEDPRPEEGRRSTGDADCAGAPALGAARTEGRHTAPRVLPFPGVSVRFRRLGAAERWPGQPGLHMPDLAFIWPADRAWCVANDVDPHWAGIGADVSAIDQLLADPRLDVVPADPREDQPSYR